MMKLLGFLPQLRVEKEILKPAERAGAWVDDVDEGPESSTSKLWVSTVT